MKANYEEKIDEKQVSGSLNMTLYELNKSITKSLPDYFEEQLIAAADLIDTFDRRGQYAMLLGRDLNYYTVFARQDKDADETFGTAVVECLKSIGTVKSIDLTMDETAVEIWVVTNDDEAHVLYLFNYDQGVVSCL